MSDLISKEEILKLASLSNIDLEDDEVDRYKVEVGTILEMIDKLKAIDTTGVEPTYQVSGNKNVMREDKVDKTTIDPELLLSLAPESTNGQIKVGKVL